MIRSRSFASKVPSLQSTEVGKFYFFYHLKDNMEKICVLLSAFYFVLHNTMVSSLKITFNHKGLTEIPFRDINANVTRLELKSNKMTGLGGYIFQNHSGITNLNLWDNRIAYISDQAFFGISNLQVLQLGRNLLTEMPDLHFLSQSLVDLRLKDNNIREQNLSIIFMQKLKILNLERNEFESISVTSLRYEMPNLQYLNLKSNKIIKSENNTLSTSEFLEELHLSGNYFTTFNPVMLNITQNLKILHLDNNDIAFLENNSFTGLHNLESLDLNANVLTEFDLSKLTDDQGMVSLKFLYLHGNQLISMPPVAMLPKGLEMLDVGGNQISFVPNGYFNNYPNLTSVNLHGMSLTSVPEFTSEMQHLTELTLSSNEISYLSLSQEFLMYLPSLNSWDFKDNSLTNLTQDFNCTSNGSINSLQHMDLRDNGITFISENYFCHMSQLEVLRLNGNGLTEFKISSDLLELEEVDLSYNALSVFAISSNLPQLEEIDLSNNELSVFPKLGSTIRNVQNLYLSKNRLQNVTLESIFGQDDTMKNTTSLIRLNLNENVGLNISDDIWASMPNLERLYMDHSDIHSLPNLTALSNLRHLSLKSNLLNNMYDLDPLKYNSKLEKLYLNENDFKALDNLLKLADSLISSTLDVYLNGNNLECDMNMCWMKYIPLHSRGAGSCEFRRSITGTTLKVHLDSSSCLCQDSWIQAEMVDLGCGLGNTSRIPHPSRSFDYDPKPAAYVSDGNLTSCLDVDSLRRRGTVALRLTTHSQTKTGVIPITLIGLDLNCSMRNDVTVAVPLPVDEGKCGQEQCELSNETVTSGSSHCSFDCKCKNNRRCEIDIVIFSGKTKQLCEIIEENSFIVDVP